MVKQKLKYSGRFGREMDKKTKDTGKFACELNKIIYIALGLLVKWIQKEYSGRFACEME